MQCVKLLMFSLVIKTGKCVNQFIIIQKLKTLDDIIDCPEAFVSFYAAVQLVCMTFSGLCVGLSVL